MFRTRLLAVAFASLLPLCPVSVRAQQGPPQHPPKPKLLGLGKWNPAPQELYAAYWTLEPGWDTELEVRNNLTQRNLSVTPVLRLVDGTEVPLAPVDLKSNEIASIHLRDAVASVKPELVGKTGAFGSVVFRFDAVTASNAFTASLVRREGSPIDFHFDAYDRGIGAIEGIWWFPTEHATDYLILSNPTTKSVAANLILSDASGKTHRRNLSLGPGQSQRVDIRDVFRAATTGATGGLSLSATKDGEISGTEIVFDETTGFAAIMKLFDREQGENVASHVLRAPMMALSQPDASLGFPNGTALDPKIFLRNAGSVSTVISPTVNWSNDAKTGTAPLPKVTLSPGQISVLSLADLQHAGHLPSNATWGAVTLGYAGRRGELVAVAVSYDKSGRYGLQTPFIEGTNHMFEGSMWHVDATHNTLITTGNGGSEPTRAQATLFYNGGLGKYRVEKLLAPGEQLWLDLGQLSRNQIPDSDGRTIPPNVMAGSYELLDLDHPLVGMLYEGKLVIDKTYGHASYGCAGCCGFTSPYFNPLDATLPPTYWYAEEVDTLNGCTLDQYDIAGDVYDWGSSDTAVATLPDSTLTAVAVGSATGSGNVELESFNIVKDCPYLIYGPTQPVAVAMPDHVTVVLDQEGYPAACPTTGVYVRQMQMQVVAANGNAMSTNVDIQEAFSNESTNSCGNGMPEPASCAATGDGGTGQFLDTMSVSGNFCGSGIQQSSGCGYSLTSTWSACSSSGSNTLWTSPRVTDSNKAEVNGSWTTYSPGTVFH